MPDNEIGPTTPGDVLDYLKENGHIPGIADDLRNVTSKQLNCDEDYSTRNIGAVVWRMNTILLEQGSSACTIALVDKRADIETYLLENVLTLDDDGKLDLLTQIDTAKGAYNAMQSDDLGSPAELANQLTTLLKTVLASPPPAGTPLLDALQNLEAQLTTFSGNYTSYEGNSVDLVGPVAKLTTLLAGDDLASVRKIMSGILLLALPIASFDELVKPIQLLNDNHPSAHADTIDLRPAFMAAMALLSRQIEGFNSVMAILPLSVSAGASFGGNAGASVGAEAGVEVSFDLSITGLQITSLLSLYSGTLETVKTITETYMQLYSDQISA